MICKLCKEEFSPNEPRNIYCWKCAGKNYYYKKRTQKLYYRAYKEIIKAYQKLYYGFHKEEIKLKHKIRWERRKYAKTRS
jgi:hypothetical protein